MLRAEVAIRAARPPLPRMTLVSNHVTGICIVRSDAHGPIMRRVATCVVVAGLGCVLWTVKGYLQVTSLITALAERIHGAGAWGAVGAAASMAAWCVLLLPLSPLELLAGFLFPFWTALLVCVVGKTAGACLSFVIARTVGARLARRALANHAALRALGDAVAGRPFTTTLLLRFAYIPAAVKNYGWALTAVRLPVFAAACLLESPVYSVPMVLVGGRAEALADIASGNAPLGPEAATTLGLGLAMLLVFFAVMRRLSRATLGTTT